MVPGTEDGCIGVAELDVQYLAVFLATFTDAHAVARQMVTRLMFGRSFTLKTQGTYGPVSRMASIRQGLLGIP